MAHWKDYLEQARDLHRNSLVVAMHTDVVGDISERRSRGEHQVLERRHTDTFRAASIDCICEHVIGDTFEARSFPTRELLRAFDPPRAYNPSLLKHALRVLQYMRDDLAESHAAWMLAETPGDVHAAGAAGKIAMILCFQGCTPLEDEPFLLEIYHQLGLRILNISGGGSNAAVGSIWENQKFGLSTLGRAFVAKAQELKMLVDVAMTSRPGFWDVVEAVDGPILCSAGNAYALCDFPGNLEDDQLKAIAEKNGVLGLMANARWIRTGKDVTVSEWADHVDYIADRIGVDHIGIGPDIVEDSMYPIELYRTFYAEEGYWSGRYPTDLTCHGDLVHLTAELLTRGYSEEVLRKVLGGNFMRAFGSVSGV